jgi:hypothetical protein
MTAGVPSSAQSVLLREGVLLQLAAVSHAPRGDDAAAAASCDAAHAVLVKACATPAHGLWAVEPQAGWTLAQPLQRAAAYDVSRTAAELNCAARPVLAHAVAANVWKPSKALQGVRITARLDLLMSSAALSCA